MKTIHLFLLALVLLPLSNSRAATRPEPFAVAAEHAEKSAPGTWIFTVSPPAPGNYRVVVNGVAPAAATKDCDIDISLDDGAKKRRRMIAAGNAQGRIDAIRVVFAGASRRITVESPDAAVTKLDFVPMKRADLPAEAAEYRPAVVPPAAHPRVLVNPALLPELRRKLTLGENLPVWEKVKATALAPYAFNPAPKQEVKYDEQLLQAVRCKAFYHLVTGDRASGLEAIALARRYMESVDFGLAQDISREIGESIFTSALVYDWCYQLLADADKKSFIDRFFYFAEEMEIGWPPFLEPVVYGHANESQISRDLLSMAIAVYDENQLPYNYCAYALLEIAAPAKNFLYASGRHDQGTAYGNYRFAWDLHGALLFKRMSGHDLFDPAAAAQVPYRWIYLRTPDGKLFREGDDFFNGEYPGNFLMNLVAAGLYGDPMLKEEFRRIDASFTVDPVFFLLINDPTLRAADRRAELPLTRFYPSPLGAMVARTGWNFGLAADDVVVSMLGAGYYYRNHQHLDAGSFQIYYRGLLLADLGLYRGYGNPFDWNFHKSTVSHTAMLIRDPERKSYPMGPRFSANSGTQETPHYIPPASLNEQLDGDTFRNGDVTARGFGPDAMTPEYAFMTVDLAKSYRTRADRYGRTMIFLNLGRADTPAAMIVYDEMKLKADRIEPIFQLTSPVRPTVKDQTLTFVNAPYGRSGKLFVETLLPRRTECKLLSGRDVFIVDGKSFAPGAFNDFSKAGTRAMITALPGEERTRFLHVLQIQDGAAAPLPVAWSENAGRVDVRIADRLVNFAKAGMAADAVGGRIENNATRTLFLDLRPGDWVLTQSSRNTAFRVDADAGSFFAVLDAGDYHLIRAGATVAAAPEPSAIWLDGVAVPARPERKGELLLLPFKALLDGKKIQYDENTTSLRFQLDGDTVSLEDGKPEIAVGEFHWPLAVEVKRTAAGEWLVPAEVAAPLLDATLFRDSWTGGVLLKTIPEAERTKFFALHVSAGEVAAWRQLWETGRSRWSAPGRGIRGEIVLRRAEPLAGIEFLRGDGNLRRAKFRVEVSADGRAFTTIFDGESSGKTVDYERVGFAPQSVRIIRIVLDGNHENEWNGLLGVRLIPAAAKP
jgi:heparin/heparan-sulfate lyase